MKRKKTNLETARNKISCRHYLIANELARKFLIILWHPYHLFKEIYTVMIQNCLMHTHTQSQTLTNECLMMFSIIHKILQQTNNLLNGQQQRSSSWWWNDSLLKRIVHSSKKRKNIDNDNIRLLISVSRLIQESTILTIIHWIHLAEHELSELPACVKQLR